MSKIQITYDWPNVLIKSGMTAWILIVVGWLSSFAWDWSHLGGFGIELPQWIRNVSGIFCLFSAAWMLSLVPIVREAQTPWGPGKPTTKLMTQGLFAMMRHPGDVGTLIFGLSAAVQCGSWLLGVAMIIWAVVVHFSCHVREEAFLASKFPAEWKAYAQKVKRYGIV